MIINKNKIKCLKCGDILISTKMEEKYIETCSCGACSAGGGSSFMIRRGVENVDYKEMSVFNLENTTFKDAQTDVVGEDNESNKRKDNNA